MSTTTLRRRRRRIVHAGLAATAVAVGLSGLAVAPASAVDPRGVIGAGEIHLTSAVETALGTTLSYAGTGFEDHGGASQPLSLKIDDGGYAPTGEGVLATPQVQGDGTVSGSITVPEDLTADTGTDAGEHWLRVLASTPVTSQISDFFTVSDDAPVAPTVTAAAVTATGRSSGVTVTVSGSGFAADDAVAATDGATGTAYSWTTGGTAGAGGNLTGTIKFDLGAYPAGEHQLVLAGSDAANPGVAQVDVDPAVAFSGLAVDSTGTVTVSNVQPGSSFNAVGFDPDATVGGDEEDVLDATFTADDTGTATGSVSIPDGDYLGTKDFTVSQKLPYAATYATSAKISPSTATSGGAGYQRTTTAKGAVAQGLYQSAYSSASDSLFATAAFTGTESWDGNLYKLDPDTLKVEKEVRAGLVDADAPDGARYAPYGVGVDDTHGTVWVTNTRQNTVAVYSQDDLSLLKQWTGTDSLDENGYVGHSRDVVADPADGYVFVSSASEGSSGDGSIAVFEADDKDGDGVDYEKIQDIAVHPRTEFSPMSLELDAADHRLFTVSSTSQAAMVIDTQTLADSVISLPDLTAGGRGASGVAYDSVTNRLFIASQNSDEVMIAQLNDDLTEGATVKELATGAGALNVCFDPVHRLAYIANFGGSTVTVVEPDGTRVANLGLARTNHLTEDGQGSVYAVNKDDDNVVVKLTPKVPAGKPALTGTAKVGKKLAATPGGWPAGTTVTYQWKRNGSAIKGATRTSYTLVAADAGKKVTVTITGTAAGYAPASVTSAAKTVAKGTLSGTKPTVSGTAKVGKKLAARSGTWTKGTTVTYQWKRNGSAIKGATRTSYTLVAADAGKKVTVTITGTAAGYAPASVTSAAKTVAKGTLAGAKPKVKGKAKVGKKLVTKPGKWSAGTKLHYQWYAGAKKIKHATTAKLKLSKKLKGKRVSVRVTGIKAGYATLVKTSAKTAKVKKK